MRLRHFAARKRKRGASLVMVLISMTILTIMGTLFTTIAMRSYQYSYSRMCRQQAYRDIQHREPLCQDKDQRGCAQ